MAWPVRMREAARDLRQKGVKLEGIALGLGISYHTAARWTRDIPKPGHRCVKHVNSGKYEVNITYGGEVHYVGRFATESDAVEARESARRALMRREREGVARVFRAIRAGLYEDMKEAARLKHETRPKRLKRAA